MNILFILHAIVSASIFLIISFRSFEHYFRRKGSQHIQRLVFISFGYLLWMIMMILWSVNFFEYNYSDLVYLYAIVIFAQAASIYYFFALFFKPSEIYLVLFTYLVSLFSLTVSVKLFFISTIIISFLVIFILCLRTLYSLDGFSTSSKAGVIYSLISLLFALTPLFNIERLDLLILISNIIFAAYIYLLIKDLNSSDQKITKNHKSENYLVFFFRYFSFVIILTSFTLIATVGIHEFGHVLYSQAQGCNYSVVIYEGDSYPYTQIFCQNDSIRTNALLAGPVLPIILAIILFFLGGHITRELSILIFGFNLLASYKDFLDLGLPMSLAVSSTIIGIIFLFFGVIYISKTRFDDALSKELKN